MLVLKSLHLSNFLSHADTVIEFEQNARLSIDGVSGAGKSSIVEAIIWVLYGEGRVDNRSLVSAGASTARVELALKDGERTICVVRSITKAGKHALEVSELGTDGLLRSVAAGTKLSQEWIVKDLLHASYELFINSVAYPQDNVDTFVKQSALKRKDLLLEIASVEDFEAYYERAKEKLRTTEEEIQRLVGELAGQKSWGDPEAIKNELTRAQNDKVSYEEAMKSNEEMLAAARAELNELATSARVEQEKLATLSRESTQVKTLVASIKAEVEAKEARIAVLEGLLKDRPEGTVTTLLDEIATIDKSIQAETAAANAYSVEKERLNSLIRSAPVDQRIEAEIEKLKCQLVEVVSTSHNLCLLGDGCLNHKDVIKDKTSFIEDKIREGEAYLAEHQKKVAAHAETVKLMTETLPPEPSKETLRALMTAKDSKNLQIKSITSFEAADKELSQALVSIGEKRVALIEKQMLASDLGTQLICQEQKVKAFNLENATAKVDQFALSLKSLNEKLVYVSTVIGTQQNLLGEIEKTAARQREIEQSSNLLRKNKEALTLIKDAFGSKGIKAVAVDVLIPQLETAINDVLMQLSDFRVTLETQKSSVDGENQIEGLFINVHNPQGQSMEYSAFSGGEKVKVTVAIAEALAGLQKVGFRLLDEAIVGLDEDSVLSFTEAMTKIQTKFPQMLVISHIPQIKDLFEDRIEVVKRNGVSMIA